MRNTHRLSKDIWYCRPSFTIKKVEKYGVRGIPNNWFPCLSNRDLSVLLNGYKPHLAEAKCRVPQDLILGLLQTTFYPSTFIWHFSCGCHICVVWFWKDEDLPLRLPVKRTWSWRNNLKKEHFQFFNFTQWQMVWSLKSIKVLK